MSVMKQLRLTVDMKPIASGLLNMMREQDENNETLIRFGLLPAKWMETAEEQFKASIRDKLPIAEDGDKCAAAFVVDGGYVVEHFSMKELANEFSHELALALYGAVDMVV